MSDQQMLRALNTQLSTLSFTPLFGATLEFFWPGEAQKPTEGVPFVDADYRSDGNTPLSTCPIQTRANRTYEVQCFVPESQGEDEAWRLAGVVSDHFFPSTGEPNSLAAGGVTIQINKKPDVDPLVARPTGFVGIAVMIRCFALI